MRKLKKGEVIEFNGPYSFKNGIVVDAAGKTVCSFRNDCTASANMMKTKIITGKRVFFAGQLLAELLNNSEAEYGIFRARESAPSDDRERPTDRWKAGV